MTSISERRLKKGFTQEYMAQRIGISTPRYGMYEMGKRKIPREIAMQIAEILEFDEAEFDNIFLPCKYSI